MAEAGARYVVVACCGTWRDGEVAGFSYQIPRVQRELRKRFMNRVARNRETMKSTNRCSGSSQEVTGGL